MKAKKITKVLIALDYSPTAQKVAEEGYLMAKNMDAEAILLHVAVDPIFYTHTEYAPIIGCSGIEDIAPLQLNTVEVVMNESQNFLDKTKLHLADTNILTVVKEGDFADAIIETASEMHADIIVMGSHSRRWLEEILMGSVTEKVLHNTTIPLYIIPTSKKKSNK